MTQAVFFSWCTVPLYQHKMKETIKATWDAHRYIIYGNRGTEEIDGMCISSTDTLWNVKHLHYHSLEFSL